MTTYNSQENSMVCQATLGKRVLQHIEFFFLSKKLVKAMRLLNYIFSNLQSSCCCSWFFFGFFFKRVYLPGRFINIHSVSVSCRWTCWQERAQWSSWTRILPACWCHHCFPRVSTILTTTEYISKELNLLTQPILIMLTTDFSGIQQLISYCFTETMEVKVE